MQFIKLISETARGKGWVRVLLRIDSSVVTPKLCSLERIGYREQFLGKNGWQVSTHQLQIDINNENESSVISFLMDPNAVQYIEAGSNYQLTLMDLAGNSLGSCTVPWKGVPSFTKPRFRTSPILTPAPQDSDDAGSKTSGGDVWPIPSVEAPPLISPETEPFKPLDYPEPEPRIVESQVSLASDEPKPTFKIKCPHGDHKIFSHMVFCPICSKPV